MPRATKDRASIEADIERFLAGGGEVQEIPRGQSGEVQIKMRKRTKGATGFSGVRYVEGGEGRTQPKVKRRDM